MKKIRIKPKTRQWICLTGAAAIVAFFAITPIGQFSVLTSLDDIDNLAHGRYGRNIEERVDNFKNHINEKIIDQFEAAGGKIEILSTDVIEREMSERVVKDGEVYGLYNSSTNLISYAQKSDDKAVYHEFGHFIDKELGEKYTGRRFSESDVFIVITKNEIEDFNYNISPYDEMNYSLKHYKITHKASEYFAEIFAYYMMHPRILKHIAPASYEYMDMLYTTIIR